MSKEEISITKGSVFFIGSVLAMVFVGAAFYNEKMEDLKQSTIRETFVKVAAVEYHVDIPSGRGSEISFYYKFWTSEFDTKGLHCSNKFQTQASEKEPIPEEGATYSANVYQNSLVLDICKIELIAKI